jgi:hypothetical protein
MLRSSATCAYLHLYTQIFAVLSLIIAIYWAKDDDTDEKFLGGLNWTDKARSLGV